MPYKSVVSTSTYALAAALLISFGQHAVSGQSPDVRDCTNYSGANTTSASCNQIPGLVCSGGCTDYVTATNCTRSQRVNDPQPPLTTERCTIGFGKSSATMYICINEVFSYTCYGSFSGQAKCRGCAQSNGTTQSNPTGNTNSTVNPPTTNTTSPTTNQTTVTPTGNGPNGTTVTTNRQTSQTPQPPTTNTTSNNVPSSAPVTGVHSLGLLATSMFATALFC